MRVEALSFDDINFGAEKILQVEEESPEIKEIVARGQVHEKIDIALGLGLAGGH